MNRFLTVLVVLLVPTLLLGGCGAIPVSSWSADKLVIKNNTGCDLGVEINGRPVVKDGQPYRIPPTGSFTVRHMRGVEVVVSAYAGNEYKGVAQKNRPGQYYYGYYGYNYYQPGHRPPGKPTSWIIGNDDILPPGKSGGSANGWESWIWQR